jgi:hypothetical protein
MFDGSGLTVMSCVRIQVVGKVYVIVAVPGNTPVTMPVPASTDAVGDELAHVPPGGKLDSASDEPWHTCVPPDITVGKPFTVSITVALQPVFKA